eukprot:TRINITY_DN4205_c0_g1_i1.p1 TRINITY_DN4205_c0_g1~~TRINITY_DN4205_c0_g1_i1.p1  ORF type:complete len:417 (-),score=72.77 TRINITY_DN4205_c0_g1_i1:187-1437(-)
MPSLVGSEMCIRDRQSTWGNYRITRRSTPYGHLRPTSGQQSQHSSIDKMATVTGDDPIVSQSKADPIAVELDKKIELQSRDKHLARVRSLILGLVTLSLCVFSVLLAIKLEGAEFSWLWVLLLLIVAVNSIIFVIFYECIKTRETINLLSQVMITLTSLTTSVCFTTFFLLLTWKLDGLLDIDTKMLLIPMYIESFCVFIFILFLFPVFVDEDHQLYREGTLVLVHFFSLLYLLLALPSLLDESMKYHVMFIYIGLFVAQAIHIGSIIFSICSNKLGIDWTSLHDENHAANTPRGPQGTGISWKEVIGILLYTTFVALVFMRNAEIITWSWYLVIIPLYIVFAGLFALSLRTIVHKFSDQTMPVMKKQTSECYCNTAAIDENDSYPVSHTPPKQTLSLSPSPSPPSLLYFMTIVLQ